MFIIPGGTPCIGVCEGAGVEEVGVTGGGPIRGLPIDPGTGPPGGPPRIFPLVIARLRLGDLGGLKPGFPFPP
jgi:hypothetical protein